MIPANKRQVSARRGMVTSYDATARRVNVDVGETLPDGTTVTVDGVPILGSGHPSQPGTMIVAEGDAWFIPAATQITNTMFGQNLPMRGWFYRYGAFQMSMPAGKPLLETFDNQPPNLPGATLLANNLAIDSLPVVNPQVVIPVAALIDPPTGKPNNYTSSVSLSWIGSPIPGKSAVRVIHVGDPTETVYFFLDLLILD